MTYLERLEKLELAHKANETIRCRKRRLQKEISRLQQEVDYLSESQTFIGDVIVGKSAGTANDAIRVAYRNLYEMAENGHLGSADLGLLLKLSAAIEETTA